MEQNSYKSAVQANLPSIQLIIVDGDDHLLIQMIIVEADDHTLIQMINFTDDDPMIMIL